MNSYVKEIYGLPGSGKSTFVRKHPEFTALQLPKSFKLLVFIWAILTEIKAITKFIWALRSTKYFRELCFIHYKLKVISTVKKHKNGAIIYDQGPLYSYVLLKKKLDSIQHEQSKAQLEDIISKIESNLDGSIYLVCDVNTSLSRVLNRKKEHIYKNMDIEEAVNDLMKWETEFEKINERLSSKRLVTENNVFMC